MQSATIALDLGRLDQLTQLNGQYRYCVDLVRGLASMRPRVHFVLLGSRLEPIPELRNVLDESGSWSYQGLRHHLGRGRYWRDQLLYAHALRALDPTIYHSLDGSVPLMSPCPTMTTQHDLMIELFPEYRKIRTSLAYRMNRSAVRRLSKRVICISETTSTDLNRLWGIDHARIDVVLHGTGFLSAPSDPFQEGRLSCLVENGAASVLSPTLLSPYNLEPRKNLSGLLRALALLHPRYPHLRLVLFGRAGVTPERERAFDRCVSELNLAGVVERTGVLNESVLYRLYRRCTLFVFPSLYEGFGLPVLEAMACGACVIARGASAVAEVVGEAGLLVETRDPTLLADAVSQLLNNSCWRNKLGSEASRRAGFFTIERMARLTYTSYCTALGIENDVCDCRAKSDDLRCGG
jgi:glycosyltransferase involved in cell wall biosynthesis